MKKIVLSLSLLAFSLLTYAQGPVITSWLQNTTVTGTYYVQGNSTALDNNILVNCQKVEYSDDFVYVTATGIPAYPTGPFPDGNPSQASDQEAIYKMPRFPLANEGNPDNTTGGNIGIFINGVSLFDYRDGVAWNPQTDALCGGPGNPPCPGGMGSQQDWNRDAIPAEMNGFDCSKAHPAMGNYHHHQNPSAFKLDINVVSDICNLYDAEGLYAIDETEHSPLIGYAYDGFPIYGAYGFKNLNGTGGIVRIRSGYSLRTDMTVRDTHADGSSVDMGAPINNNYPLGYFREDYRHVSTDQTDVLDDHNGRFAITPEYPDGVYAYYATVDENWNSAYPYVVGPTFYGNRENRKVNSVNEATTIYTGSVAISEAEFDAMKISVIPNPATDLIAVQVAGLTQDDLDVELIDINGKSIIKSKISAGTTIAYFDVATVYAGTYFIRISGDGNSTVRKVVVMK